MNGMGVEEQDLWDLWDGQDEKIVFGLFMLK